jgi:hypothetical protein
MDQSTKAPAVARGQRIIHLGLLVGLVVVGGTFLLLLRVNGPLTSPPGIGVILAGVAVAMLALALIVLRGKVPPRRFDQSADDYWGTNEARSSSIMLWAAIEAAGLLSWMGYVMTGQLVPAAVALLSIVSLAMHRPSRLERAGAA